MKEKKHKKIIPHGELMKSFQANAAVNTTSVKDYIFRKKELILLDYQSLFDVYGREFNIVYSFRGWAISLLTAYFGFLFAANVPLNGQANVPGLFIIIGFYLLEVAERSVMKKLLREVRSLEKIFMIQSDIEYENAVTEYEFRDLRDAKTGGREKIKYFLASLIHPQVLAWNTFLVAEYLILIYIMPGFVHPANPITK